VPDQEFVKRSQRAEAQLDGGAPQAFTAQKAKVGAEVVAP